MSDAPVLYKKHPQTCPNRKTDRVDCDCPWRGKFKSHDVDLSEWGGEQLDPRKKRPATYALSKLWMADHNGFSPLGYEHSVSLQELLERPNRAYSLHPAHRQKFLRYAAEALAASQALLDIVHRYELEPVRLSFFRKPLSVLRRIVRSDRGDGFDLEAARSATRHASDRALRRHLADLVTDGLLIQVAPDQWRATDLGKRFQGTSRGLIRRETADAIVEEFVVRAKAVNADASLDYRVRCAVLFGSYLTDLPKIGDVDIAVSVVQREEHVLYVPLEGIVLPAYSRLAEIRSKLRGRSKIDLRPIGELEALVLELSAKGQTMPTRVLVGEWTPPDAPKPVTRTRAKRKPKPRFRVVRGTTSQ